MFVVSGVAGAITGPGGRALSCEVVDQQGGDNDSCTVVIDDRNAELAIPANGTKITVSMGYMETGVVLMGMFVIEEVTVTGWPRTMIVQATGANLTDKFKQPRAQDSHDEKAKVGVIIQDIASRNGLSAQVTGSVANIELKHFNQEESDLNTVTRLADRFDATGKVTNNKLVFAKKGEAPAGTATAIYPINVKDYNATFKGRPAHMETQGSWWDQEMGERKEEKGSGGGGRAGNPRIALRQLFPMFSGQQPEAQAAAQGEADKNARGEATLEMTLIGDPGISAETLLTVSGVRPDVDGTWRIKSVQHIIDNSGYETSISAELPA
jgi:hypothetical protein